jgi:hypothetical protein
MTDDRIESHEERLLVLRDKAAREGFVIGDDVLDYIAGKYALATTLKGALINVQALASRKGVPVTLSIARLALDGIRETAEPQMEAGAKEAAEVSEAEAIAAREAEAAAADAEAAASVDAAEAARAAASGPQAGTTETLFTPPAPQQPPMPSMAQVTAPAEVHREPAEVWFAPMRTRTRIAGQAGRQTAQSGRNQGGDREGRSGRSQAPLRRRQHRFRQPIFLRESFVGREARRQAVPDRLQHPLPRHAETPSTI